MKYTGNRTERIEIRATPEEKQALTSAAAAAGLTLTGYILFKLGEFAGEAIADQIVRKGEKKN